MVGGHTALLPRRVGRPPTGVVRVELYAIRWGVRRRLGLVGSPGHGNRWLGCQCTAGKLAVNPPKERSDRSEAIKNTTAEWNAAVVARLRSGCDIPQEALKWVSRSWSWLRYYVNSRVVHTVPPIEGSSRLLL